ncbi:hypothetical protein [Mycobacterium sp. Marseille-P9652]|uniref:hypothetical protein n=1 Tax=Mycobacterium sp. Marseille-P9652 TaxID=2654950 RepID=UPI001E4ED549|nr:hypothetical protein [Mycobacterium sp. Marseille-P9652]
MANDKAGTVIFLESHPTWIAAQRRKRELTEAMRRHPSALARQRIRTSAAANARMRHFAVYSSGDTPA